MSYIGIQPFDGWYECTVEDFCERVLPHFGLTVCSEDVQFSGFWNQGDGASFTGLFYLRDVNPSELKSACPTEDELHNLAEELAELATAHSEIQGSISRMSSLYSHSNTMVVGGWGSNNGYCNEDTEAFVAADAETSLIRIFRQLADWLYSRLEEEYNFQLADTTASYWADAIEERKSLQVELEQLQVDVAANPPQSPVQARALSMQISNLRDATESLTTTIDQLSNQFHYWQDGKSLTVEQFHEEHF